MRAQPADVPVDHLPRAERGAERDRPVARQVAELRDAHLGVDLVLGHQLRELESRRADALRKLGIHVVRDRARQIRHAGLVIERQDRDPRHRLLPYPGNARVDVAITGPIPPHRLEFPIRLLGQVELEALERRPVQESRGAETDHAGGGRKVRMLGQRGALAQRLGPQHLELEARVGGSHGVARREVQDALLALVDQVRGRGGKRHAGAAVRPVLAERGARFVVRPLVVVRAERHLAPARELVRAGAGERQQRQSCDRDSMADPAHDLTSVGRSASAFTASVTSTSVRI